MKNKSSRMHLRGLVASLLCLTFSVAVARQPESTKPSNPSEGDVLILMQRVADWQLANPSKHPATDWTQGAGDAGMMALAGISGDAKYRDAMLAMGEANQWQLGPRYYHADDYCVGQTYAELYFLKRENKMIAPLRERFDGILAKPGEAKTLALSEGEKAWEHWCWCDALFMGPTAWMRLYAATDDARYMDFAVKEWWRTTDYLYDKEEHLFYRDDSYFEKREANGKKIFWSRGNGWVMAGMVRVLQYLPTNHPDRPRFEKLFKEMAAKILTCQQPDGLWRASLLDPEEYPMKESSGSGFYTYALAWGINQGLLDRMQYEPAVLKAWSALSECVDADGKLTHVQPIGADPKKFDENATEVYGVGAFLLAGSEVYRLMVFDGKYEADADVRKITTIRVRNPSAFRRDCETVEIKLSSLLRRLPKNAPAKLFAVMDGVSSRVLDSQMYNSTGLNSKSSDTLVFQVDLAPGETRTFYIVPAALLPATPPPIVKTFARFVPERMDDFAWESDRAVHRTYGQALIKGEGSKINGIDVWSKNTRELVIDKWYKINDYHNDHGEGMDDYHVGPSRGCGGLGIWDGKNLMAGINYKTWKLITTGPVRSEFELTYDAWDAAGRQVSEVKRISIDAGSWISKATSTLTASGKGDLTVAVGLVERPGKETIAQDKTAGWMTYWQPVDRDRGSIACAILLTKKSVLEFTNDKPDMPESVISTEQPPDNEGAPVMRNLLAITKVKPSVPFTYYFGSSWDKSGDFKDSKEWDAYVAKYAKCRDEPLVVLIVL